MFSFPKMGLGSLFQKWGSFSLATLRSGQSKSKQSRKESCCGCPRVALFTMVLIVGGGITSAQLALLATEANWCVESVTYPKIEDDARHFDIENDWMGPQRGKLLEDFWCLDVNDRVKKLKETRGGGTIPPEIICELVDQSRTSKKLQVKGEVELSEVHWIDVVDFKSLHHMI